MEFAYKQISKYRSEIMGIAILLIMFCHNTFAFPGFLSNINSGFKMLAQVGVDIFFFMSGFGCYFSMKNNSNPLVFYKKRLIKILPPYVIVIAIYMLHVVGVKGNSLAESLWNFSLISFFTESDLHEWFIAAILVLYLIFPLLFCLLEKAEVIYKFIIFALYIYLILICLRLLPCPMFIVVIVDIMLTRTPAFLLGAIFAKRSCEEKIINSKLVVINLFISILLAAVNLYLFKFKISHYWTIIRTDFILVAFSVMFIWIAIREKIATDNIHWQRVIGFLTFIGALTLEIYLIHEKLLEILSGFLWQIPINIINILAVVLSIVSANYLNKLVGKITGK